MPWHNPAMPPSIAFCFPSRRSELYREHVSTNASYLHALKLYKGYQSCTIIVSFIANVRFHAPTRAQHCVDLCTQRSRDHSAIMMPMKPAMPIAVPTTAVPQGASACETELEGLCVADVDVKVLPAEFVSVVRVVPEVAVVVPVPVDPGVLITVSVWIEKVSESVCEAAALAGHAET